MEVDHGVYSHCRYEPALSLSHGRFMTELAFLQTRYRQGRRARLKWSPLRQGKRVCDIWEGAGEVEERAMVYIVIAQKGRILAASP